MIAAAATALAATSGQPLPGFLAVVGQYLAEYGYWAILVLVLVEDFGIPVPGETILIAAAVDAGTGRLNVVLVGVVGFAAAVAGDNIGYAIGRFGGRALVARWGRYVMLTEERLDKAEGFFNAHGGKIIVVARFIEGLRQANGIIAGIIRMRWPKFLAFNTLGAALWVGCWVSAGYFGGRHIATIYRYVTQYSLYALIVLAVALVAWILLLIRKRRRKARAGTRRLAREASRSAGEGVVAVDGGEGLAGQVQDQEAALGQGPAHRRGHEAAVRDGQGGVQQERQVLPVRADDRRVPAGDQRLDERGGIGRGRRESARRGSSGRTGDQVRSA